MISGSRSRVVADVGERGWKPYREWGADRFPQPYISATSGPGVGFRGQPNNWGSLELVTGSLGPTGQRRSLTRRSGGSGGHPTQRIWIPIRRRRRRNEHGRWSRRSRRGLADWRSHGRHHPGGPGRRIPHTGRRRGRLPATLADRGAGKPPGASAAQGERSTLTAVELHRSRREIGKCRGKEVANDYLRGARRRALRASGRGGVVFVFRGVLREGPEPRAAPGRRTLRVAEGRRGADRCHTSHQRRVAPHVALVARARGESNGHFLTTDASRLFVHDTD
jgi:hypothetical protein